MLLLKRKNIASGPPFITVYDVQFSSIQTNKS